MIIKLSKIDSGFEVIDRETIQAIQNSTALAIWVYLQSKPENWNVSEKEILSHFDFGRDRYLKAMRHLRDLGLYEFVVVRDDHGKIKYKQFKLYPQVRKTVSMENPTLGKSDPIKNTESLNNTEVKKKNTKKEIFEKSFKSKKILRYRNKINISVCDKKILAKHNLQKIAYIYANYVARNKNMAARLDKWLLAYEEGGLNDIEYTKSEKQTAPTLQVSHYDHENDIEEW